MIKARWFAFLLAAAMLVSLCACDGRSGKNPSDVSSAAGNASEEDASLSELREKLRSESSLCGAIYLGYVEEDATTLDGTREIYERLCEEGGYLDQYTFLKDIPDKRFVFTSSGRELYLIIPRDGDLSVTVNEMELGEEDIVVSDTLYKSKSGEPILLQCNYSDIFSDAQVVITASDGETLKWSPFLSLRDGKLQTSGEDGRKVLDFTRYTFTVDEDDD